AAGAAAPAAPRQVRPPVLWRPAGGCPGRGRRAPVTAPPAKPTTAWSSRSASRTSRTDSSTHGTDSSGSGTTSRSTSAIDRTGAPTTGPTFSTSSTSTPIPRTGSMMSANITAASTSCRRTGCSVTSAQSAGCRAISTNPYRLRSSRYSGSERPACRMNQTGVRSTGSRRAARTSDGSTRATLPVAGAVDVRYLPRPAEPDRARSGGVAPQDAQLQPPLRRREPEGRVGGGRADVDEEAALSQRQPGEVELEPLEPLLRQTHAVQRLGADGPAVGAADADGDACVLDLLQGIEPYLKRHRLALD